MKLPGHPILSCAAAQELEAKLFRGDEALEWEAMGRAGEAVGRAVLDDLQEIGGGVRRVLVLAGKGHNAGDALLAAELILRECAGATVDVIFALGTRDLRPLAAKADRQLAHFARERLRVVAEPSGGYDVCLDGVFGFQFRPPLPPSITRLFARVEELPVRLRAAVDLPSGLRFRADFTYATGSVKEPLVDDANAGVVGRLRYLDLGFFGRDVADSRRILTAAVLDPLRGLRDPRGDKRSHGHLFIVAGSPTYPGAALLSVLAALRSGVGLVTAFVPEALIPAFAARAPGAIWAPLSEFATRDHSRATALAIGPGMGHDAATIEFITAVVRKAAVPLVIDADALQPQVVSAGKAPRILTPHAGELRRLGSLASKGRGPKTVVVEKGRLTAIRANDICLYSPFGGPVLARGGSGDLLTGILGGLLACRAAACGAPARRKRRPYNFPFPMESLLEVATQGVVWHGRAADKLAQTRGQVAVEPADLLEFMGQSLL